MPCISRVISETSINKRSTRVNGRHRQGMVQLLSPAEGGSGERVASSWKAIESAGSVEYIGMAVLAIDISGICHYCPRALEQVCKE